MAKAVIQVGPSGDMSSGEGIENTREGYTKETYNRKNQDPSNNYDWSRRNLNFEIADGKIIPLGSQSTGLYQRYQMKLADVGYKEYKAGATNRPITYVPIIFSGSPERMQVGTMSEAEARQWALDTYKFCIERFGEDSVIGFEVHGDEKTWHAHCNLVPIGVVNQRGNVSGYIKVDANGNPVTYEKGKHIGEVKRISESKFQALSEEAKKGYRKATRGTIRTVSYAAHFGSTKAERSERLSDLHTQYHKQVGCKYGLERGEVLADLSDEERRKRRHLTKQQRKALNDAEKERIQLENQKIALKKDIARLATAGKAAQAVGQSIAGLFGQSSKDKTIKQLQNFIDHEPERTAAAVASARTDERQKVITEIKKAADLHITGKDGKEIAEDIGKAWRRNLDEKKKLTATIDNLREMDLKRSGELARAQKNIEDRDAVIYRQWPQARNATDAIFRLGSSPTAKDFTLQQAHDVERAITSSGTTRTDAAKELLSLAQKDFHKNGTPQVWVDGAADIVKSIAQGTHPLLTALLKQQSNDSGGGPSYVTDLTDWAGNKRKR